MVRSVRWIQILRDFFTTLGDYVPWNQSGKREHRIDTPFAKDFDMNKLFVGFLYALQSTSLSLPWEIAHAYLQNPRKILLKKFIHIEILGERCRTKKTEFAQFLVDL